MIRTMVTVVGCVILAVFWASTASAGLIGSYTINEGVNSSGPEHAWITFLSIRPSIFVDPDLSETPTALFNGPDADYPYHSGIDPLANIGETFWAASNQDDPEFSLFIDKLTDGSADDVRIYLTYVAGGFGYAVPLNQVVGRPGDFEFTDLHDYVVERIGLTINSATHTVYSPESHQYTWDITVTFEGEPVPEPTSLLALMGGLGTLGILRKRSSRQKRHYSC